MVKQVRAFLDQPAPVAAHRFDDRLDGFLAYLLRDLLPAQIEVARGAGGFGVGAAPAFDDRVKPVENIRLAHMRGSGRTGMPAAAMDRLASAME